MIENCSLSILVLVSRVALAYLKWVITLVPLHVSINLSGLAPITLPLVTSPSPATPPPNTLNFAPNFVPCMNKFREIVIHVREIYNNWDDWQSISCLGGLGPCSGERWYTGILHGMLASSMAMMTKNMPLLTPDFFYKWLSNVWLYRDYQDAVSYWHRTGGPIITYQKPNIISLKSQEWLLQMNAEVAFRLCAFIISLGVFI